MGFISPPRVRGVYMAAVGVLGMVLVLVTIVVPGSAHAAFGFKEFDVTFTNADGSPATQAGSHPFAMTTSFDLNTKLNAGSEEVPDDELKDLTVEQVAGLVGAPAATPRCSTADFLKVNVVFNKNTLVLNKNTSCPNSTVLGLIGVHVIHADLHGGDGSMEPVFNLVPPPGVAVKLGFVVVDVPVTVEIGVSHEYPYDVTAV